MSYASALVLALILDAFIGEPDWAWKRVPHPAVLMGRAIEMLERGLNEGDNRFFNGALGIFVLAAIAVIVGQFVQHLPFGGLLEIIVAAILLAQKSLAQHVQAVADALRQSTEEGRKAVAMIVGRDTQGMTDDAIARGAIESAAENFSDGVVAPAFWFLIAGLPGLMAYKLVNTADSMIGYRNERYEEFGKFAARLDDVLNWVPARLTAVILALASRKWSAWHVIRRDAPLHRSPNAGWPEAAMARTLNVALSGPRAYHGEMRDFPWVNDEGARDIGAKEVDQAVDALWSAWLVFIGIVFLLSVAT
ncbi:adenosylcobinamide-phosphate synthase [Aliiroseovarius halocynthiae]|uniref:Cobalamin biosynthesis protein CobD n=1 Tax=Aliiroseovarius halocynthiae TaxID=985055 RepID=A0A545SN45_9RHOB|nr:adenosylcobinamide-phosphate synthase CbiB [Aliiroseovarius halocynthiae]TQV66410.1 cobalamin biosynthesis protein [Aliiroseovarius halocynthiae]SMR83390.1 adenosylcobinamide-phosphate synthase [Aliiroseovarius halocynthiae]